AIARDEREDPAVREAAIAALGQRPGHPGVESTLDELMSTTGRLASVARLALLDLVPPQSDAADAPRTIAQLFLHADM
ncbi:hypothetical protein, partial [Bacillus cereus]